jgi:two-component system, NtrC family, nitrogen regulation sensor histidine kinase NtrY
MKPQEILRYRKDPRFIIALPLLILAVTSLVYYFIQKAKELSPEALSSRVLLFVLFDINLILILGIVFVLLRGVVKLILERQRGIVGSRFRTRLVITWVATSLVPVVILFLFASDLLRVSIDRWFNPAVRTLLQNSEAIAAAAQGRMAAGALSAAREIAASEGIGDPARTDKVLAHVREFHNVDVVGVYRDGAIIGLVANPRAPLQEIGEPPQHFFDDVMTRGFEQKIDIGNSGKWIRCAVPVAGGSKEKLTALAGVFIPDTMSRMIDENIIAHKSFQQLDSQRPALKASQTSLFLAVTLAILFFTLWTSIYASRRITVPIKALAEATTRLAEGGYGHRIDVSGTDELGRLIDSFNQMSQQIESQREALTDSNEVLQQLNRRLDDQRAYLFSVLDSVSTGIIAFNEALEILSSNPAALRILQIDKLAPRASLDEVLSGDLAVLGDVLRHLDERQMRTREVTLIRGGELRYLEVSAARLESAAGQKGWVVAIEDSTQLVQAQKLAAWNEAARRIAHEIKNPLTPIQLSAERIAKKYRNGDADTAAAVDEGCGTIVSEVNHLKRMVDEFSRFARMPAVHLRQARLSDIAEEAAALYHDVKPGVSVVIDVDPSIQVVVDPEQIRRALVNLLSNAIEATERGVVRIAARKRARRIIIDVADEGRGVPDNDKEKLFLPYFSTKGRGTGLGLAIVHRIVNDHDGRISVHDNQPKGTRFEIELPA